MFGSQLCPLFLAIKSYWNFFISYIARIVVIILFYGYHIPVKTTNNNSNINSNNNYNNNENNENDNEIIEMEQILTIINIY